VQHDIVLLVAGIKCAIDHIIDGRRNSGKTAGISVAGFAAIAESTVVAESVVGRMNDQVVLLITAVQRAIDTVSKIQRRPGDAPHVRIAHLRTIAEQPVLAVQGNSGSADSIRTLVQSRARNTVIARGEVVGVIAAQLRLAEVVGARVVVAAVQRTSSLAPALAARIVRRADVAVVALSVVGNMGAAGSGDAGIVGAYVGVVADELPRGYARAEVAMVARSTHVFVIAGDLVQRVNTAGRGIAIIRSAYVVVVAVLQLSAAALAAGTGLAARACIAVITGRLVRAMKAEALVPARVVGARIAVVAVQLGAADTLPVVTLVVDRARIAVAASAAAVLMDTPGCRVAFIRGAGVGIVAIQAAAREARPLEAMIARGACVQVIAVDLIVYVDAPVLLVAKFVGAGVVVFARYRDTCLTAAFYTLVSHGAGISVVAGKTLVVRHEFALARPGFARGFQAYGIHTLRFRTNQYRFRVYFALVRPVVGIADECPVAQVAVLEGLALLVVLAVARNGYANALAQAALVGHGARVGIVATVAVILEQAPAQPVARIIRARVAVIAHYRGANALPVVTVISHGTGIAVLALSLGQGLVRAALRSLAGIDGALVFVVAGIHVFAAHKNRLVDLSITVVVDSVARFLLGHMGITVGKPLVGTDPLSLADSPLVFVGTGSPQSQGHRLAGTGTNAGIGQTLAQDDPIHCFRFRAGESPRALFVIRAWAAAETAFSTVFDARVFRPAHTLTIVSIHARPAEIGIVGNADVDNVRNGPGNLAAGPAGRAFLLAELRADALAHMLHAPA